MKSVGIVKEIDSLGRVIIPVEIRYSLGIGNNDPLVFFMDDEKIALKKYLSGCFFCANAEGLKDFNGKKICMSCLKELGEVAD